MYFNHIKIESQLHFFYFSFDFRRKNQGKFIRDDIKYHTLLKKARSELQVKAKK